MTGGSIHLHDPKQRTGFPQDLPAPRSPHSQPPELYRAQLSSSMPVPSRTAGQLELKTKLKKQLSTKASLREQHESECKHQERTTRHRPEKPHLNPKCLTRKESWCQTRLQGAALPALLCAGIRKLTEQLTPAETSLLKKQLVLIQFSSPICLSHGPQTLVPV